MADYTISVTFGTVALGGAMSDQAILEAIQRTHIDAQYVDNIPSSEFDVEAEIEGIIDELESQTGDDKLDASALKNLIKTNVSHASKALNYLATGNVWSGTFQTANPSSGILQWDFFIASSINTGTNGTTVETKDWCIALTDNPGFDFTDTTKWYILKVSHIPTNSPAFRKFSTASGSGIMPDDAAAYQSVSVGLYSLSIGKSCVTSELGDRSIATGDSSVASRQGSRAHASGCFTNRGEAQHQESMMRLVTTNNVPTEMVLPEAYLLATGKTYDINVRLLARDSTGLINKSWEWKTLVGNAETDSIPAFSTALILSTGTNNLSASLSFSDGPSRRMIIECTGISATIRWVALINAVELYHHVSGSGVQTAEHIEMPDPITYVN